MGDLRSVPPGGEEAVGVACGVDEEADVLAAVLQAVDQRSACAEPAATGATESSGRVEVGLDVAAQVEAGARVAVHQDLRRCFLVREAGRAEQYAEQYGAGALAVTTSAGVTIRDLDP
jgi:hypothetical protein